MDQLQWTTPNKNEVRCQRSPMKSPVCHKTPMSQNETRHRQTTYQNSVGGFTVLPSHITPPSGLTKFIARNPFEADLTNRLHLSVISPTVFSKIASPSLDSSGGFAWSVEELALIQPARIEEFPEQQVHCVDPEIEVKAQAAIAKFFNANQIIPSPWDTRRKESKIPPPEMETPTRPLEDLNTTRELHKSKRESWTQTTLSLPPQLPKSVEEALKPYFTFTQDQNESEEANLSNSSLRRKLFFTHDDGPEDEQESALSLSPVRSQVSMDLSVNSPPQSGMLTQGSPLRRCPRKMQRNHGTPVANSANLSPPNMSPISNNISEMSCQSIRSRCSRSVARLDFTADMSIETSILEEKKTDEQGDANSSIASHHSTLSAPLMPEELNDSTEDVDNSVDSRQNCKKTKQNETVEMVLLSEETTPIKRNSNANKEVPANQNQEIVNRFKLAAEWCKLHSNESYPFQHSNTFSGQQSTLNIAQDTGYQTYSMNNTTSIIDNTNVTPTKQNIRWDERVLVADDELHLSDWKQNMKHMFSSTPSKYTKEREN